MRPGDLSREDLIERVQRIMPADAATEGEDLLVQMFEDSVALPAASALIFYPHKYFGEGYRHKMPTAMQVVDVALAYKPTAIPAANLTAATR